MPKKLDEVVEKITHEYEAKGYSPEHSRSIAWATMEKEGYVERKGKHMHLTEKGRRDIEKEGDE